MYRFRSKINKATLDSQYRTIYARAGLQRKWIREVAACPELANTLPAGVVPDDLLTMKYEDLVDVYNGYRQVYNGLSAARQSALNSAASAVFTYGSYRTKIAEFLTNPQNGFEIYNCVYCDLTDARPVGNIARQFDTEHILDKGECPLVGLSLYNFCPACDTCNTRCKGTNPIGSTPVLMKKLSPTAKQYDFENKVHFVLNIVAPEAVGRIRPEHPEWYEVDFEYKDWDYEEVVTLFQLKPRYNLPQHKESALGWRFKAKKYKGIALAFTALIHGNTIAQEYEELFRYNARRNAHSEKMKLMRDMLTV